MVGDSNSNHCLGLDPRPEVKLRAMKLIYTLVVDFILVQSPTTQFHVRRSEPQNFFLGFFIGPRHL
jgi:hypothetical protein